MRRTIVGGVVFSALAVGACSDGATARSNEPAGAERTATTTAAITASSGAVTNYRHVRGVRRVTGTADGPPADADCRAQYGGPCYSPKEIQTAYGVSALIADGIDGKGQTILVVDAYGSPTIAADLAQFDRDYGLPDPPSFKVVAPIGSVPFDPTNDDMVGWAFESTLDVEWAHALAPGADIVLLTTPVSETEGTVGMPEMLAAMTYALDHHLGKIITQSWGATENTLFDAAGQKVLGDFERFYARARHEHVTVFAAAGDNGSSNEEMDGTTFYPFPTVGYPCSSPNVTAIGGTTLTADTSGNWQSEVVWEGDGAGGGGVSQYFGEPLWQWTLPKSTQQTLAGHRGLPDVSYNADPASSILVYLSIPGLTPGYFGIGGTSEGSPQWAGIAADFNQLAGRPLGFWNAKLYTLGALGLLKPFTHDITVGNNGDNGVVGYDATAGWDLASGWGTPKVAELGRLLGGMPDDD
jgi:subtilase family serine protease